MNSVDSEWLLFLSKQDSVLEFNSVNINHTDLPVTETDTYPTTGANSLANRNIGIYNTHTEEPVVPNNDIKLSEGVVKEHDAEFLQYYGEQPNGVVQNTEEFPPVLLKMKEDSKIVTTKPPPVTECVKPFELIISTKTKVLFLNKSIDIFSIFWKIPIVDYWKPEKGVIKKQIKIVSKTKQELEEYQAKLVDLNYYQENIIKQIDNPTSRSIKFKDERKLTVGMSKKDITVQRTRVKNAFYNCMALILRFKYDNVFKEIHVKVFNTGKMEIPGIVNYTMLQYVKEMILDILQTYGKNDEEQMIPLPVTPTTPVIENSGVVVDDHDGRVLLYSKERPEGAHRDIAPTSFSSSDPDSSSSSNTTLLSSLDASPLCFIDNFKEEHVLINSNFNCGYFIHRERLYNVLISPKYGLEASFDPCNYSGVKCRYYFNNDYGLDRDIQKGVIMNEDKRMKLSDLMECKKYTEVSLMIFRTGSCIIVGNCSEKILRFIFEFIKEILITEYREICFNDEIPQVKNKSFKMIKRNISVSK